MIKPLRDYVVLETEPEERKVGSIIIKTKEDDNGTATVVAVGPGYKDEHGNLVKADVKVGDKVFFKKYATNDYKEGENHYLLVKAEDIIGIIK